MLRRVLTAVAVVLCAGLGVDVHCPELFRQDGLCDWIVTVGLAEAGLVCVWRVPRDSGGWDRAVVGGVPRVRQAELATDGTALQ